ncbi:MAG: NADH-quinone oxidoreductase subunit NuoH [Planctomycetota bacterium]
MREFLTSQLGVSAILALVVFGGMQGAVAYCIYFERKVAAWVQDRWGPNRAGPMGLLQPIADGVKFLLKEDIIPGHVDKPLFILAPGLIFLVGFIGFAAIPWGGAWEIGGKIVQIQVANPDIGLLYVLGVASMSVYGVVLGGYASNNKYSFYGAVRATAQMLSYEIPMGLCILIVVITLGTLRLEEIVTQQAGTWWGVVPMWNVFLHPLAFFILFVCALAESNRAPFDMAEAEQELVGGYHTEYGALKFGMFFLAEYAHMITGSALIAVLFFGGWHLPWIPWTQAEATQWYAVLAKMAAMGAKITIFLFVMMWIRWTLPRFRFDQLMRLAWKGLIPVTLGLVVLAVGLLYFGQHRTVWALAGNVALVALVAIIGAARRTEITGREENLPAVPQVG